MDTASVSQMAVNFIRTGDVITIKGTGSAISLGFEIWPDVPLFVRSVSDSGQPCNCEIQILTESDSIVFSEPFSGEAWELFTVRQLARHRVVVSAPDSVSWQVDVKDSPPQFVGPTPTPTTVPATPAPQSVTLTASRDTTIFESGTGALSNGKGTGLFAGKIRTGPIRRALIQFDVAGAIPSGATINAVTLAITVTRATSGSRNMDLHRLTANWGEGASLAGGNGGQGGGAQSGDATWLHSSFDGNQWGSAGGDFSGTQSAVTSISGPGAYTWTSTANMVADVQFWLDNQSNDFGSIILGDEGSQRTGKGFASREHGTASSHPQLTIAYTP